MGLKFQPLLFSGFTSTSGGGSSPTIGGPVVGGTDGSVLFVHPTGVMAQDNANFNFNDTTHQLTIGGNLAAATFNGYTPENVANKGAANGYAPLDGSSKVPYANLPYALMTFKGAWNPTTNTPTLTNGTGTPGDTYRASVNGTSTAPIADTWFAGDFIIYNGSIWQRSPLADGVISVNGFTGAVTLTQGNLTDSTGGTDGISITGGTNAIWGSGTSISQLQSSASQNGYLASADWTTFNNKQNALTFGSISSGSTNLSVTGGSNSTVGPNVTVSLITGNLTDAGTDGITITSGTGAVLGSGTSISQHVADGAHNGYLSSTDWNTFNNKQSTLTFGNLTDTGTDGIVITNGTGAVIGSGTSIAQSRASGSQNGYLAASDWVFFNGKQNALTFGSISTSTTGVTVGNGASSTVGPNVTVDIATASGSQTGLLSSTDWNTFNNKQPAGSYANTTLNNLASTAVNSDINPGSAGTINLGLFNLPWAAVNSEIFRVSTGSVGTGLFQANQTLPDGNTAGAALYGNGTNTVGIFTSSAGNPTPNIYIETGNSTGGSNNSGSITLSTGSVSTGTRGQIILSGASINASTQQIHNVVDPTSAQDAATKNYVDTHATGGTVTSVALADSTGLFNITGSPVTTSGTLTLASFQSQSANTFFAAPNGSSGAPSFRNIVAADVPTLNQNTTGTASNITATSNSTLTTLSALALPASQLTGTTLPSSIVNSSLTSLGAQSQALNMNSHLINNVTNPVAAQDAATKSYVDNAVAGINPAVAVQAATTTASNTSSFTYNNGVSGIGATLTSNSNNTPLTVDGYTFTALGQRLLVKNDTQSPSGAFNGIYYVTQVQAALLPLILTRALDYDSPNDMNNTGAIPVINGTVNGTTQWVLSSQVNTVGTDPLTFTQFARNPSDYLLKANNLSDVSNKTTAFDNIAPTTTQGDIIYYNGTDNVRLGAGSSGYVLTSNGASTNPSWQPSLPPGAVATDWQSYPLVIGGSTTAPTLGTTSVNQAFWRRLGDTMEIQYFLHQTSAGTAGSGYYLFPLPTGYAIDTTKTSLIPFENVVGNGQVSIGNSDGDLQVLNYDTQNLVITNVVYAANTTPTVANIVIGSSDFNLANTDVIYSFIAKVPIAGWTSGVATTASSQIVMSQILATGTNVTTTPTALGQYRTLYRASANTQVLTDTAPNAGVISTANGIAIYSSAYNAAGTAGQPGKYEIFIGYNKTFNIQYYANTGRAGGLNTGYYSNETNIDSGVVATYDPSTGVLILDALVVQGSSNTSRFVGLTNVEGPSDGSDANVTSGYFDVSVANNQFQIQVPSPFQRFISSQVTSASSTITSTSMTTFSNSPALTFTPSVSGQYKVYANIPIDQGSGTVGAQARVFNTSGGASLLAEQQAIVRNNGAGTQDPYVTVPIESSYTLIANTTYVFDVQGVVNSGAGAVALVAGVPWYLIAERCG